MMEDSVTLREHLEKVCCIRMQALGDRMTAHEREHELLADALGKAEAAVNQRLGAMNELRDQINKERVAYASKEYVESEVKSLLVAVTVIQRSISNMEGRAWALAIAIPLLMSGLVSVAVKLL